MSNQGIVQRQNEVELALVKYAPLVILAYKEKNTMGFLFATKTQRDSAPWFPTDMKVSPKNAGKNFMPFASSDGQQRRGAIVLGIGNYLHVHHLAQVFKEILADEVETNEAHPKLHEMVVNSFAEYIDDEYRSSTRRQGYLVELAVLSYLNGQEVKVVRVKHDGDYHEALPFCILGGLAKTTVDGTEVTVRHQAIELARKVYANDLPDIKGAGTLAGTILNLGDYKGTILVSQIDFESAE